MKTEPEKRFAGTGRNLIHFFTISLILILTSCSKNQYLSQHKKEDQSFVLASKEIEASSYNYSPLSKGESGKTESINTGEEEDKTGKKKELKKNKHKSGKGADIEKAEKDNGNASIPPPDEKPVKTTNKRAVKAFMYSVIGFFIPILGFVFMSLGFANGIKAMNEIRRKRRENKGMGYALAAWIIPIAWIVLALVALYIYIVYLIFTSGGVN
jgi:hypothetical protein